MSHSHECPSCILSTYSYIIVLLLHIYYICLWAYAKVMCTITAAFPALPVDRKMSLPMRLVAGRNKYEGNVQVQYEGEWGYVCGAVWDITAANVVCKQLGSTGAARVKTFEDYSICRVWLDQVKCRGNESSIWDCSHNGLGIFQGACSASEYAGVVCNGEMQLAVHAVSHTL